MENKQTINISDQNTKGIFLVDLQDYQLIHVAQNDLRIRIYNLKDDFADHKFDFFAFIDGNLTGFIVENLNDFEEFHLALDWYAVHVGQPFFKLFKDRP